MALFSDMVVQEEPVAVYRCHNGTSREVTPDGALQTEYGWHVVFDVTISSGAMLPLHIWNRKVHGHGTPLPLRPANPHACACARAALPLDLTLEPRAPRMTPHDS